MAGAYHRKKYDSQECKGDSRKTMMARGKYTSMDKIGALMGQGTAYRRVNWPRLEDNNKKRIIF